MDSIVGKEIQIEKKKKRKKLSGYFDSVYPKTRYIGVRKTESTVNLNTESTRARPREE